MTQNTLSPQRFVALDSLRGLCALMVALFHFRANSHVDNLLLVRNSWLFVDFFFVLSGFVIAASYGPRLANRTIGLPQFIILRLARLYPLHLFVLTTFVFFETLMFSLEPVFGNSGRNFFTEGREFVLLPENILLLQSLNLSGIGSWNVPAWSISAEFWTYVVFSGAIVLGTGGRILFLVVALLICPLVIWFIHDGKIDLEADGGIVRCLMGFGVGVLLQKFWRKRDTSHFITTFGLELAVLSGVVGFVIFAPAVNAEILAPLVFAVAVWTYSNDHGPIAKILQWRGFLLVGILSYSIYMTHTFVHARVKNLGILYQKYTGIKLFNDDQLKFFGTDLWMGDLFLVVCLAASLLISFMTYHWIEMPGQLIGRRFLTRTNSRA